MLTDYEHWPCPQYVNCYVVGNLMELAPVSSCALLRPHFGCATCGLIRWYSVLVANWPLNVLVLVSLGRVSHSGQGQPLLMTSLGIPSRSYESGDIKSAADCAAHGGTWESPCSKLRTAVTRTEPSITQQKA